nr:hypothetical protein [Tanacetum cinerariifolium]
DLSSVVARNSDWMVIDLDEVLEKHKDCWNLP